MTFALLGAAGRCCSESHFGREMFGADTNAMPNQRCDRAGRRSRARCQRRLNGGLKRQGSGGIGSFLPSAPRLARRWLFIDDRHGQLLGNAERVGARAHLGPDILRIDAGAMPQRDHVVEQICALGV
jgi:hypothetical protein